MNDLYTATQSEQRYVAYLPATMATLDSKKAWTRQLRAALTTALAASPFDVIEDVINTLGGSNHPTAPTKLADLLSSLVGPADVYYALATSREWVEIVNVRDLDRLTSGAKNWSLELHRRIDPTVVLNCDGLSVAVAGWLALRQQKNTAPTLGQLLWTWQNLPEPNGSFLDEQSWRTLVSDRWQ